ncbi:Rieske 2Fe-2S domain-containing protein [Mycobacterium avium]|nr:Rieske 2Fe-2S domain-containing protein [Mycobacterium avium]
MLCPCHGSKFAITDGHVAQGPATSGLGKATVTQKSETLTISGS